MTTPNIFMIFLLQPTNPSNLGQIREEFFVQTNRIQLSNFRLNTSAIFPSGGKLPQNHNSQNSQNSHFVDFATS